VIYSVTLYSTKAQYDVPEIIELTWQLAEYELASKLPHELANYPRKRHVAFYRFSYELTDIKHEDVEPIYLPVPEHLAKFVLLTLEVDDGEPAT